jgi:signal transduction histidine kinase
VTKHPRWWLAVVALVAAAYTLVAALSSVGDATYGSTSVHAAVETAGALISLLAAHLMYGRFRRTGERRDLAIATGLAVLATVNLAFSAIPAVTQERPDLFATWGPIGGRALAGVILAVAAFLPDRIEPRRDRAAAIWFGAWVAGLVAIRIVFVAIDNRLPEPFAALEGGERTAVILVQVGLMAIFALAGVGFARLAARTGSMLWLCFAVAAALSAFARLNYVLFPSDYGEWFITGDMLRLAAVSVLLVGGVFERRDAQHEAEARAVSDERRRIARELHDGVAQELAFIVQQVSRLAEKDETHPVMADIASSARRALQDSRDAIAALVRPNDEPLAATLSRAAEQVARREQVQVEVDVPPALVVPPETREALLRILHEAVTNAARHGHAKVVHVTCSTEPRLRLLIADDGSGFDPGAVAEGTGHYGISGMRERVERLGGAFAMESSPGDGARLEVVLP